jgi:hypothetical protein
MDATRVRGTLVPLPATHTDVAPPVVRLSAIHTAAVARAGVRCVRRLECGRSWTCLRL